MSEFGFSNAEKPGLVPLEKSYAVDNVEQELKQIFIDFFKKKLATQVFDANVLGAAHLGTFGLVQKIVNKDGLAVVNINNIESATRYLYRAWLAGNNQGRGAQFIRTYMQLLFPGEHEVYQLWQDKSAPYPELLYESEQPNSFLTSRFRIYSNNGKALQNLVKIQKSILSCSPARFVISVAYNGDGTDVDSAFKLRSTLRIASIGHAIQRLSSDKFGYQHSSSRLRIVSFGNFIRHMTFEGQIK